MYISLLHRDIYPRTAEMSNVNCMLNDPVMRRRRMVIEAYIRLLSMVMIAIMIIAAAR